LGALPFCSQCIPSQQSPNRVRHATRCATGPSASLTRSSEGSTQTAGLLSSPPSPTPSPKWPAVAEEAVQQAAGERARAPEVQEAQDGDAARQEGGAQAQALRDAGWCLQRIVSPSGLYRDAPPAPLRPTPTSVAAVSTGLRPARKHRSEGV